MRAPVTGDGVELDGALDRVQPLLDAELIDAVEDLLLVVGDGGLGPPRESSSATVPSGTSLTEGETVTFFAALPSPEITVVARWSLGLVWLESDTTGAESAPIVPGVSAKPSGSEQFWRHEDEALPDPSTGIIDAAAPGTTSAPRMAEASRGASRDRKRTNCRDSFKEDVMGLSVKCDVVGGETGTGRGRGTGRRKGNGENQGRDSAPEP